MITPEYHEQTALRINGKKRKLRRSDFDALAQHLGINKKTRRNNYQKFGDVYGQWIQQTERSFLSDEMKKVYKACIKRKSRVFYRRFFF
ncbi:MAG: hypothetical protein OXC03_07340 [Flavobacteriaceae bacterium]|nr:hypothetical protein [Flavobacteriaceae bacterium]